MPKRREPVDLLIAKGRKHLTKREIEERRASEIKVPFTDVKAPDYLSTKQREEFMGYAEKLLAIGIFTELDVDVLARYVLAKGMYLKYTAQLARMGAGSDNDAVIKVQRLQSEAFKQCRACGSDLGLSITSRCKLQIPQVENEEDYEL